MTERIDFLVLGPLEARRLGRALKLGSIKHRMLLAKLLLHANQVVSTDELIDTVWGEQPPPTVRQSLQNHVAALRRAVEEGRSALEASDPWAAARLLHEAVSLWRGPVLADVVAAGAIWPELAGIDELRIGATEARIEADLVAGRHHDLIGELEALVRQHPLREHLHGHLMLALYRSGRQADALAAYRDARHTRVDELGIEPSVGLQRLEQAILHQDES